MISAWLGEAPSRSWVVEGFRTLRQLDPDPVSRFHWNRVPVHGLHLETSNWRRRQLCHDNNSRSDVT